MEDNLLDSEMKNPNRSGGPMDGLQSPSAQAEWIISHGCKPCPRLKTDNLTDVISHIRDMLIFGDDLKPETLEDLAQCLLAFQNQQERKGETF